MALLDKFKSKPQEAPKKTKQKSTSSKTNLATSKKTAKPSANKQALAKAYKLIEEPYITEKAVGLNEANKYVFKVSREANKLEIKKAIKTLYGVDAIKIHILKTQPKKRRLGRYDGWRKGLKKPTKKAIITLKPEDKIEFIA